ERNIAWIAATRAKYDLSKGEEGTIVFCGSIPQIYEGTYPTPEVDDEREYKEEFDERENVGLDAAEVSTNVNALDNELSRFFEEKHDDKPEQEDDEPPF